MLTLTFTRPKSDWEKHIHAGLPYVHASPRIKVSNGVTVNGLRLLFSGTIAEIATFDARIGAWIWRGEAWTSFDVSVEDDDSATDAVEEGGTLPGFGVFPGPASEAPSTG